MDIQTFLNDLKVNKSLKKVFNYCASCCDDTAGLFKEFVDGVSEGCKENPSWYKQYETFEKIQWLFTTNDNLFALVGVLDEKVYFVDSEGDFPDIDEDERGLSLFDIPFFTEGLSEPNDYMLREDIEAYLDYFDYCNANGILLMNESYAWKPKLEELNEFHIKEEKRLNKFISDLNSIDVLRSLFCVNQKEDLNDYVKNYLKQMEIDSKDILLSTKWFLSLDNNDFSFVGIYLNNFILLSRLGNFQFIESLNGSFVDRLLNLPFQIHEKALGEGFKNNPELLNDFILYFTYCEKNKFLLTSENYALKAKILKF